MFETLRGTLEAYFKVGGYNGVRLKNNSGDLIVRNTDDSADAAVTASKVNVSGNAIDLNSDAAGSGADFKYTVQRPSTGMTAAVTMTLPVDDGTPGQVLSTDGFGVTSWAAAANTALCDKLDTTDIAFGSTSPVAMFTTGASDVIEYIDVIVDTAFNGSTPSVSIGISGTTSKYVPATNVDLKTTGCYRTHVNLTAQGAEALIATYVASASSAGAARVIVHYATPA